MEGFTVPSATRNPKLRMKESNIWIAPESAVVKASNGCRKESALTPTSRQAYKLEAVHSAGMTVEARGRLQPALGHSSPQAARHLFL